MIRVIALGLVHSTSIWIVHDISQVGSVQQRQFKTSLLYDPWRKNPKTMGSDITVHWVHSGHDTGIGSLDFTDDMKVVAE